MYMSSTTSGSAFEERRLAVLHGLALLDSEPEAAFDSLVTLAAATLDCPSARLTLVDRDRIWIKASATGGPCQLPRDDAYCGLAVRDDAFTVFENAAADPRLAGKLREIGDETIGFYAGMPIHAWSVTGDAYPIGAICIMDSKSRVISDRDEAMLEHFARLAETLITARSSTRRAVSLIAESERQAVELERKDQMFRQAERMARIGGWRVQLTDNALEWTEGVLHIHDLPLSTRPNVEQALQFYPPDARQLIEARLQRLIDAGDPLDLEVDFVSAAGVKKRVRTIGELEFADGVPVAVIGVFRDVSEEYALSLALRHSADTDGLTRILNRAAFARALDEAMARAANNATPLALALIDLDAFKMVNDTLGHVAGDDVLREVAERLCRPWLHGSVAARLGGDEFALIVEDPGFVADPDRLRARLEEELCVPVTSDRLTIATGGSVGVAVFDASFATQRAFVNEADAALYIAKRSRVGDRRRV